VDKAQFAPTTPERIARNEAIFREANDGIRAKAESFDGASLKRVPFICEGAEPRCRELLLLTLDEYRKARESDRWFLNAVGHDAAAGPYSQVIVATDRYVIAEKLGEAGEHAERFADEGSGA
jgi:hypothetical protein